MKKLYTITGTITFQNGSKAERYIQLGDAGRPVIQTRTGYKAERVILFRDSASASDFAMNFIYDRNRIDIKWEVKEYNPSRSSDTLVGLLKNDDYINQLDPGEIYVSYNGEIRKKLYKMRFARLNGKLLRFYCRSNSVKFDENV